MSKQNREVVDAARVVQRVVDVIDNNNGNLPKGLRQELQEAQRNLQGGLDKSK